LLHSVGKADSLEIGKQLILNTITDGSAIKKFRDMMVSQGTKEEVAEEICFGDKWKFLPKSQNIETINSDHSGNDKHKWFVNVIMNSKE
jgi:thymidine phosphorylase